MLKCLKLNFLIKLCSNEGIVCQSAPQILRKGFNYLGLRLCNRKNCTFIKTLRWTHKGKLQELVLSLLNKVDAFEADVVALMSENTHLKAKVIALVPRMWSCKHAMTKITRIHMAPSLMMDLGRSRLCQV